MNLRHHLRGGVFDLAGRPWRRPADMYRVVVWKVETRTAGFTVYRERRRVYSLFCSAAM
jgi:hypothetical protein